MTRRLDVTERQLIAVCRAAEKTGRIPRLTKGDIVIELPTPEQAASDKKIDTKGRGYL